MIVLLLNEMAVKKVNKSGELVDFRFLTAVWSVHVFIQNILQEIHFVLSIITE